MNENIKSKLSGLRGLGKSGRELTASDIRLLLNSIFDNGLGDGVSDVTGLGLDSNLFYGVNVLGSGLLGDKTIRLPNPPIKGRVVKIINNTGYVIYVRPSVEGGSINGVVDGSAGVPSDGKIYEFVCWENPLPGAWSWTPPAVNQLDFIEFSVAHTNGVQSLKYTNGVQYDNSVSVGSNGNSVLLTGTSWKSNLGLDFKKVKIYSNVVDGDCAFSIACWLLVGYFVPPMNGVQSQVASFGSIGPNTLEVPVGGSLASPPNVGDDGTYYDNNILIAAFGATAFSYTFGIQIPASAASKTYKFKAFIEYN